jgi:hypothetical protein
MNHRRFFFTSLAALVGVAAFLALRAGGQVSPDTEKGPPSIVEVGPDNSLIERTTDGKILRVTQRSPNVAVQVPYSTADGRTFYVQPNYGGRYPAGDTPHTPDAESLKLMAQEQAAAQEARALSAQAQQAGSDGEKADAKKKLREKLAQIFDLQQERRTREITKIEERLGKLKDTLKKRETSKDSIIDRRLETITGGVDELGWEESLPTQHSPNYGYPTPGPQRVPMLRPGAEPPTTSLPEPTPYPVPATAPAPPTAEPRFAPPPVAPRAGAVPAPVPPAPAELPASAAPPVAPVPAALPVPASRGR